MRGVETSYTPEELKYIKIKPSLSSRVTTIPGKNTPGRQREEVLFELEAAPASAPDLPRLAWSRQGRVSVYIAGGRFRFSSIFGTH